MDRDFPFVGENAIEMIVRITASTASADLGFKSIFVDSQALDFCFKGGIGDSKLSGGARWSRYPSMTLGECCLDHFFFVCQQLPVKSHARMRNFDGSRLSHVSSTANVSESLRVTARSITFCSSRTFPGQSYSCRIFWVFFSMVWNFFPILFPYRQ